MNASAVLLSAALLAAPASAEVVVRSGPARARLIELYTSEGCSSCPPADAWLSGLKGEPGLWTDFVPLEFHVDYWDGLGWPDRLASPAYTARQRAYAAAWGTRSVYTPGVVLDGAEWRGWGGAAPRAGAPAGALEARVSGGRVRVSFAAPSGAPAYDVWVARLGFGLLTNVAAGENAGRALRHDFVVRALARAPMARRGGRWSAELTLPPGADAGAAGLAVWVTGPDGAPVQAAGGLLPPDARR
jgi:hypothetical protein